MHDQLRRHAGLKAEMVQARATDVGQPFHIAVPDDVIEDLRDRLRRTRFPRAETGQGWRRGVPLDYAERLRDHWLHRFDWRAQERRFNRFEQQMIEVEGRSVHAIVEPGTGPDPTPLLLANGWPSSFVEFDGVIERLAHPERYGGGPDDAFTVIVPAMPGYGFSPPPREPLSPREIGRLWNRLMTDVFGFDRYVAVGSDWGSLLVASQAFDHPDRLRAVLLTTPGGLVEIGASQPPPTPEEAFWMSGAFAPGPESAYQAIQASKPQSLAFGQTDSPIGLATWIVEKFHAWTCPESECDPPFPMDDLIANVVLYWLNGCAAPMWLYGFLAEAVIPAGARAKVPAGFMFFPNDLSRPPPQSYLERAYDVRRYRRHARGGHFPAQETPDLFVDEVVSFFRSFR